MSKHIIEEDDELSDHAESNGQSGKEIANLLCNMPHEKLLEVVQRCLAIVLQQFLTVLHILRLQLFQFQRVPVSSASGLQGWNQAKKANSLKVPVLGSHVGLKSAKTDSFLVSSAHIHFCRCCGSCRYRAVRRFLGFFSWIQLSLTCQRLLVVTSSLLVVEGTLLN